MDFDLFPGFGYPKWSFKNLYAEQEKKDTDL